MKTAQFLTVALTFVLGMFATFACGFAAILTTLAADGYWVASMAGMCIAFCMTCIASDRLGRI